MKTRFGAKDSLITNESVFLHRADAGQSRFDFVPLKGQNMANAKHLRKRIALVAAAALGVGMLVAAPAFALSSTVATCVSGTTVLTGTTTSTCSATGAVGTAVNFAIVATAGTTPLITETQTVTPVITGTAAAASAVKVANLNPVVSTLVNTTAVITPATGVAVYTNVSSAAASGSATYTFTPDVPGTYILTYSSVPSSGGATTPAVFTYTATMTGPKFLTTGNTPAPVAQTVTNGSTLAATTGGFATFALANGDGVLDTYNVTAVGGNIGVVTVSGSGGTTANINGTNTSSGIVYTPTDNLSYLTVQILSSGAATTTVTVTPVVKSTGVPGTAITGTVTWSASGASAVFAASTSTSVLSAGTTYAPAVAGVDDVVTVAKGTGTQVANIKLSLQNASATAYTGTDVTATVSGPALIIFVGTPGTGIGISKVAAITPLVTTGLYGVGYLAITGDGTAGVATITISVGSTVFSTETVTFTGALASLTATKVTTINKVGANAGSVTVLAKDAAGNPLGGVTVFSSSGTTATATVPVSAVTAATTGIASFTVTGVAAGTSVLTFGELATAPTVSTTTTVTVGGVLGTTVTLAFDKASYAPGGLATLTLTVKDASGNPVADGTYTSLFTADLTSSTALGGASLATSASPALVNGVKTWTVYAPVTAGAFSVNGTTGTAGLVVAAQGQAVTGASTVAGSTTGGLSAADSAAIAAAKAAADSATAAVATLSTTVASLVASITAQIRALSAQIAKLFAKSGGTTPGLPKTGSRK
jgi:hypothetical protein